ncbi:MAG: FMN-binding negative transcriptional regulator [Saprospiraceae bacterium]
MHVPNINKSTNKEEIIEFMKRFSFATIISTKDDYPIATHLPFVVSADNEEVTLISHFAKNNEQWKNIIDQRVLVIFNEPHAYISPKHYEKQLNVPTWNYIAVHCYGTVTIISEQTEVLKVLEGTINNYEKSYKTQWDDLPEKYKIGMMNGIVAFKVTVSEIQANEKLSQDKKVKERHNIINELSKSNDTNEKIIAEYMLDNEN